MAHDELARLCIELLTPLGTASARRMFGGHGVYLDDLFVAIVADGRIWLKADAQTQPAFRAAGSEPFVYATATRTVALGYWSAPADALESPAQMRPWARLAIEAALRARAASPPAARRKAASSAPAPAPTARQPNPAAPRTKRR